MGTETSGRRPRSFAQPDPERTFAVVVGIEEYLVPGWAPLDGPASDAVRFVRFLIKRRVPPANIYLFLSPLEKNRALTGDLPVLAAPAVRDSIYPTISQTLQKVTGDLLYFFWGGHGVSDAQKRRYLFYGDATKAFKANLQIDSLLEAFETTQYSGLSRQVCIVDACANFEEELDFDNTIPREPFVMGKPRAPDHQFVIFASRRGQTAKNFAAEQTGALSREVLRLLEFDHALLPDMPRLAEQVQERFEILRAENKVRQVPEVCEVIGWGGDRKKIFSGERVMRTLDSATIAKQYDRTDQDTDFLDTFSFGLSNHPSINAFVVYGEDGEAHTSFIERVLQKHIRRLTSAQLGEMDGTVTQLGTIDWPVAVSKDLRTAQRRLVTHLAQQADLKGGARDHWTMLLGSPTVATNPVVVIPHRIRMKDWSTQQQRLLGWYLKEFWRPGGSTTADALPTFVLFLNVICAERMAQRTLQDWIHLRGCSLDRLRADLSALSTRSPSCQHIVLEELKPLSIDDVHDWFHDYLRSVAERLGHDTRREAELVWDGAERRRDGIRRTDRIENRLLNIHRSWTRQEGMP
jgi:hypothetical protein